MFAAVQKHLQNCVFTSESIRGCSPMFMWVGVLLVYTNPRVIPKRSHLNT
jgi:hypothetical protein